MRNIDYNTFAYTVLTLGLIICLLAGLCLSVFMLINHFYVIGHESYRIQRNKAK